MAFFTEHYPRLVETPSAPVIVYADEGWGQAKLNSVELEVRRAVEATVEAANWRVQDVEFLIAFAWRNGDLPMIDLWRFGKNPDDDSSGPLVEARILRDGKITEELGIGSGNTILVLGLEESHRRSTGNLTQFFKERPPLPRHLVV